MANRRRRRERRTIAIPNLPRHIELRASYSPIRRPRRTRRR